MCYSMATGAIHEECDSTSPTHSNICRGDDINSCSVTRPFLFLWRLASLTYIYVHVNTKWLSSFCHLQIEYCIRAVASTHHWCVVVFSASSWSYSHASKEWMYPFSILSIIHITCYTNSQCLKSFLSDSCLVSMKIHYQHTVIRLSLLALPTYFILVSHVVRESTTSMSICSFGLWIGLVHPASWGATDVFWKE